MTQLIKPFGSMCAAISCACLCVLVAVPASGSDDYGSWPYGAFRTHSNFEQDLVSAISPARLREFHDMLGSEPHCAGTAGDARNITLMANAFRNMGLDVEVHRFQAYLSYPMEAAVEVVSPERVLLSVKEKPLDEDRYTHHGALDIGWNAYSASGDVTAEVVYVNRGTKADFARLADLGVDLKGKIAIARYGGNFRGYKAKFAQAAGAVGLIIYTDPQDDGYARGAVYPEGGYANEHSIQRGSIKTLPYPGDPLTPMVAASPSAKRLDPRTLALPKIPVQPIGYDSAHEILSRMTGPIVPRDWQGGLPFAYRLTGGESLRVRVMVRQERRLADTANVIATLKGSEDPNSFVVIGSHHDAWNCGAADPLAGTICMFEAARALVYMRDRGVRPTRSIKFCAWGAEEYGIIGSTEWVERERENLLANAVGYINLDMSAMGPNFSASATPSIRQVVADAASAVPQCRDGSQTVLQSWHTRSPDPAHPGMPQFGNLGGGSDHIGFVCHVGVPSVSMSSHGSAGVNYHTNYDTLTWYRKIVGEDYEPAMMVTRMTAVTALRLAAAPLVPIDASRVGHDALPILRELTTRGRDLGVFPADDGLVTGIADSLAPVAGAAAAFAERATRVMSVMRDRAAKNALSATQLKSINAVLIQMDRAWLDDRGLPDRPWFRSLHAASDEYSGYASWMYPEIRRAIEDRDAPAVRVAARRVRDVFDQLESALDLIEQAAK